MSQITTHVLDISVGKPASGIDVILYNFNNATWIEIAAGITDNGGRITNLLAEDKKLERGIYKINFHTGKYFEERNLKKFYPFVDIIFEIDSDEHYHIPLLLSPFGYTTYRGS